MTRLALILALQVATFTPCAAGEVRQAKRVGRAQAKPIRVQARADNGWPFRTTVMNVTGTIWNVSRALPVIAVIL